MLKSEGVRGEKEVGGVKRQPGARERRYKMGRREVRSLKARVRRKCGITRKGGAY